MILVKEICTPSFYDFVMFCNVQEQCTTVALFKGVGVFQQGRECKKHVLLDLDLDS